MTGCRAEVICLNCSSSFNAQPCGAKHYDGQRQHELCFWQGWHVSELRSTQLPGTVAPDPDAAQGMHAAMRDDWLSSTAGEACIVFGCPNGWDLQIMGQFSRWLLVQFTESFDGKQGRLMRSAGRCLSKGAAPRWAQSQAALLCPCCRALAASQMARKPQRLQPFSDRSPATAPC